MPDEQPRMLPGSSASSLFRAAAIFGGIALLIGGVGVAIAFAFETARGIGITLAVLGLVGVGFGLIASAFGWSRERDETEAGYSTLGSHINLPKLDPRHPEPADVSPPASVIPQQRNPAWDLAGDDAPIAPGIAPLPAKAASRVLGGRFERAFPLPVTLVGFSLLFAVVIAGQIVKSVNRFHQTLESAINVAIWTVGGVGLTVIILIAAVSLAVSRNVARVAALRPGHTVFGSSRTDDGRDALISLGWKPGPTWYFAVSIGPEGVDFWTSTDREPSVQLAWSDIAGIEVGEASDTVWSRSAIHPAILLAVHFRGRLLLLPLTFVAHRSPSLRSYRRLNELIDEFRARWEDAYRAARNQRAASGGSVSSADAGRPPQGSSDATTDP